MGSEIPYKVIVNVVEEKAYTIFAITSEEAKEKALQIPGVVSVLEIKEGE